MSPQNDSTCRFGLFELNLRTGELRKNGQRVRLQDQPRQVLLRLIKSNGEIVSREGLRSTLWHGDTFVDFETGLNTAVKRLREALGDSADHPTFIETIPRRGYRFIAPLEWPVSEDRRHSASPAQRDSRFLKNRVIRAVVAAGITLLSLTFFAYWRSGPSLPVITKVTQITNDGNAKDMSAPVTDGVNLYFMEGLPYTRGSAIFEVSAAGGEVTRLPTTLGNIWAVGSISPDRSQLFAAKFPNKDLWAQPLPAGAPHRVGNIESWRASWTRDGTHIVYGNGGNIMVAKPDGSEPRQLAKVAGVALSIHYSPDGQRIRFDLIDPRVGSTSIWEMGADGRNLHPLFPDWKVFQDAGDWSPDGNYYYFRAGREHSDIWVMPERHSIFRHPAKGPSRLTSGPLRFGAPVPSSDGKRLFAVAEDPRVELLRYNLKAHRFDPFLPGLPGGMVAYAPDQKWIAYVSYPDMTLWRSRVDGRDKMQLTFPPTRVYGPRWSPDGSQIAFMDMRFGSPWKIFLVSASGGSPRLIVGTNVNEADPTWTPDGKSIVFGTNDFATNDQGGKISRLDLITGKVSPVPNSVGLFSPRVSPDGRYIAALSVNFSKLMLFDSTTQQWSSLAEGERLAFNEWSPDGKYIYLRRNLGGAAELIRVKIKDHKLDDVVSLKDFPQRSDILALWFGFTPDGNPLLLRDRSIQEIYAIELEFQ